MGCGRGGFLTTLRRLLPLAEIWGIEPDVDPAQEARTAADRVIFGRFPEDLPEDAPPFDVVFFNDVLEHLVDPWSVLLSTRALLSHGGVIVASIPNIRYWKVLHGLLRRSEFKYTDAGVLDRTHLRFFSKSGIENLFHSTGYSIARIEALNLFSNRRARALSHLPMLGPDILAPQFAVVAG